MAKRSSVEATIQALKKKLNELPEKDRSEIVTLLGQLTSAYAKAASSVSSRRSAARVRKSMNGDPWIGVAKTAGWIGANSAGWIEASSAGWVGDAKVAPRRS